MCLACDYVQRSCSCFAHLHLSSGLERGGHICIYIYIQHIYIYIYIYIYICICTYVYIHTHIYSRLGEAGARTKGVLQKQQDMACHIVVQCSKIQYRIVQYSIVIQYNIRYQAILLVQYTIACMLYSIVWPSTIYRTMLQTILYHNIAG